MVAVRRKGKRCEHKEMMKIEHELLNEEPDRVQFSCCECGEVIHDVDIKN